MINMHWHDESFEIQKLEPNPWKLVVNTAELSPFDIWEPGQEPAVHDSPVLVPGRSITVLMRAAT
jgi:hypothetical protein